MERGENIIRSYEANSRIAYSELGKDFNKGWNNWGNALYKGRWASIYTDKEMIDDIFTKRIEGKFDKEKTLKIADFGGGDGFLLHTIIEKLKKDGVDSVGINIDESLSKDGKTLNQWRKNRDNLNEEIKEKTMGLAMDFVNGNEKGESVELKENSIDVGLMRYVIQYTGEKARKKMLDEVYKYIKPSGKLYCLWPGEQSDEQAAAINSLWSRFANISQGADPEEFLKEKWYPTIEEINRDAQATGFIVSEIKEIKELESRYSLESLTNGSRFEKFTPDQKNKLRYAFEELHEKYPNFIDKDNYRHPIIIASLEKPVST